MQIALVVNPTARTVARHPEVVEAVAATWRRVGAVEVLPTTGPDSAFELAREVGNAVDVLVVLSGDGTLNSAANGLASVRAGASLAALAAVPGGATNVFARSVGLPRDPVEASTLLAAGAAAGDRIPVDAGRLDGRLFLANAGIGFDAAVVARADRHHSAKRRLGVGWFTWCMVAEASRRNGFTPGPGGAGRHLAVDGAQDPSAARWAWVVALARSPYTYVGPAALDLEHRGGTESGVGAATATTPGLTVLGIGGLGRTGLAAITARAVISSQGVIDSSRIARIGDRPPLRLVSDVALPTQVDGDYIGDGRHFLIDEAPAVFERVAASPVDAGGRRVRDAAGRLRRRASTGPRRARS